MIRNKKTVKRPVDELAELACLSHWASWGSSDAHQFRKDYLYEPASNVSWTTVAYSSPFYAQCMRRVGALAFSGASAIRVPCTRPHQEAWCSFSIPTDELCSGDGTLCIWYNTSTGIRQIHPGKGEHDRLMHPCESIDWYPIVKRYTTRLVHIRSVSPGKGEIRVAREVLRLLQEDGFASFYTAIGLDPLIDDPAGRSNAYAFLRGKHPQAIVLLGHIDTVTTSDFGALEPFALDPAIDPAALIANLPIWNDAPMSAASARPGSYRLPLEAMRQLNLPVVNLGPYGKGAHQPGERVLMSYAFGALPQLVYEVIEHLACETKEA